MPTQTLPRRDVMVRFLMAMEDGHQYVQVRRGELWRGFDGKPENVVATIGPGWRYAYESELGPVFERVEEARLIKKADPSQPTA